MRYLTEEHGYNSGGCAVSVDPKPGDRAREHLEQWKTIFQDVVLIGGAILTVAHWLGD